MIAWESVKVTQYAPPPADRYTATWQIGDTGHEVVVELRWDNEAWTAECYHSDERVNFVMRLSPTWQIRQFILFRDMEEPDLWLATDGAGRWGEMNGAHRTELDGCRCVDIEGTPFTNVLMIRSLPLQVGHSAEVPVIRVDLETLATEQLMQTYTRITETRWQYHSLALNSIVEVEVDEFGFVIDEPGSFTRVRAS
jgi:uncharacterized protein